MNKRLNVYYGKREVGELWVDQNEIYHFRYTREWERKGFSIGGGERSSPIYELRFTNYDLDFSAPAARGGKASDGPAQGAREAGGQDDWTKAQLLPAGR